MSWFRIYFPIKNNDPKNQNSQDGDMEGFVKNNRELNLI